jgi:hypothetical protein
MKFGGEGVPFGMVSGLLVDSLIASFTADSVSFYEEDLIDTLTISTLVLKNMNAVVTDTILFVVDAGIDFLEIANCSASQIDEMPTAHNFTLRDIGVDQCLGWFIETWSGNKHHLTNCPGLDDNVLRMMGEDDGFDYYPGRMMRELHIHQCNNFSLASLQTFVQVRNEYQVGTWGLPLLSTLWVDARFPLIETDIDWFSDQVQDFCWRNIFTYTESDFGIDEDEERIDLLFPLMACI